MFFRVKRSDDRVYVQLVENAWEKGRTRQRVIATIGRLDQLMASGELERLLRSGQRFLCDSRAATSTAGAGPERKGASRRGARKRRILVVDDELEVLRALVRSLERLAPDIEVEGCLDGIDALVKVGRWRPDLLLLDIYMAGMDGFAVCRRLRQIPHLDDLKIVAMTAFPSEEARTRILGCGADAFLAKPVDLQEVAGFLPASEREEDRPGRGPC